MEMQTEVTWLHVPWTRIYYYGGTSGVSAVMESFGISVCCTSCGKTTY